MMYIFRITAVSRIVLLGGLLFLLWVPYSNAIAPATELILTAERYRPGETPELLLRFDAESRARGGAVVNVRVTHETGGELYTTKQSYLAPHDVVFPLPISEVNDTRGIHFVLVSILYGDGTSETLRTYYVRTPQLFYVYAGLGVMFLVGVFLVVLGVRRKRPTPLLLTEIK